MDAAIRLHTGGTGGGGGTGGKGDDGAVATVPVDARVPDAATDATNPALDASLDGKADGGNGGMPEGGIGLVTRPPKGGLGCQGASQPAVMSGACTFELAAVDGGAELDLINLAHGAFYWSRLGFGELCGNAFAWYYDDAANPTQILACPMACGALTTEPALEIIVGCPTIVLE